MKKFLFPVCVVLAILGCGGDNVDELPCLACNEPFDVPGSSSPYGYGSSSSAVSNAVCPLGKELKCSMSASLAYTGTAVYPRPIVTCGDENVSGETVWSPEGLIFTEPGNDFVVAIIGNRPAPCGSILVIPPPLSSSSGGGSSSSGGGSSSSEEPPPPALPGLTCWISESTKYLGMPFNPVVRCNDQLINGSEVIYASETGSFQWDNGKNGLVPGIAGTNIPISASINSPCINSLTHQPESIADCGTVNVEAGKLLCTGLVQTGYKDQVISKPEVTCDGVSASSVEWLWNGTTAPTDFIPATAGNLMIEAVAECGGRSQTETCGTVNVKAGELKCDWNPAPIKVKEEIIHMPEVYCDSNDPVTGNVSYGRPLPLTTIDWPDRTTDTTLTITASGRCGAANSEVKSKLCGTITVQPGKLTCTGGSTMGRWGDRLVNAPNVECDGENIPYADPNISWTPADLFFRQVDVGPASTIQVTAKCGSTLPAKTIDCAQKVRVLAGNIECDASNIQISGNGSGTQVHGRKGDVLGTKPLVKCTEINSAGDDSVLVAVDPGNVSWVTPAGGAPTAGGSQNVEVGAVCGGNNVKNATCGPIVVSPGTLTCNATGLQGRAGDPISTNRNQWPLPSSATKPTVTCDAGYSNEFQQTTNNWFTPSNGTPTAGGNLSLIMSALCGGTSNQDVTCTPQVAVDPATPSCTGNLPAMPVDPGTAITSGFTVTCDGQNATGRNGVNWSGAANSSGNAASNGTVVASIFCGGNTTRKDVNCPGTVTLTVPGMNCEGYAQRNTICPNVPWDEVHWDGPPRTNDGDLPVGCYYLSSKPNNDLNIADAWRLNGTQLQGQANLSGVTTIYDGGYYLYQPSKSNLWFNGGTSNKYFGPAPFCVDGQHELYCTGLSSVGAAGVAITQPTVTCRSGDFPVVSFTGAPNWSNPAEGSYNVDVTATCGSSTTLGPISCGSIQVNAAGSGCEAQARWGDICPNTVWPTGVQWNVVPPQNAQTGCYYVTAVATPLNIGSNVTVARINGTPYNGYVSNFNEPKVDNGYYMYFEGCSYCLNSGGTAGTTRPACSQGGGTCEYLSSYCNASGNGVKPILATAGTRPTATGTAAGSCVFVSDFARVQLTGSGTNNVVINGTSCTTNGSQCAKPSTKKDNGYYIHVRAGALSGDNNNWQVTVPSSLPSACNYNTIQ